MKITKLLSLSSILLIMFAVISAGCNKNDSVLGPNGLNNSGVSFSISQQSGNFGGVQFLFKPGQDVKISRIISSLDAQHFADTNSFTNTNYVYSKDTTYIVSEYTGVENGQQWKFTFTGSAVQNNSNYTVTTNYTAH
jgi:hypothetical protein